MLNKNFPSISVVMSVYNGIPYISDTIKSILNQTFEEFEFIIIDDGSTDGSSEVIEKFQMIDQRITLLKQPNQGIVASLNRGIEMAKAPLIARIDADDIAVKDRLEKQVQFMNSNLDVLAVGTAICIIDEENKPIKDIYFPSRSEQLVERMQKNNQFAHPSVMFRKDKIIQIGGYREILHYAEDYDLWLRLSEMGAIENLKEVLLLYRDHSKNISKNKHFKQWIAFMGAKFSAAKRREGNRDPMDDLEAPLTLEKLKHAAIIPKKTWTIFLSN